MFGMRCAIRFEGNWIGFPENTTFARKMRVLKDRFPCTAKSRYDSVDFGSRGYKRISAKK